MMHRHKIELWTDEGTDSVLVSWVAEAVDEADVTQIADSVELWGSALWAARALATVLTVALLYGPERARARLLELQRSRGADPTLF